MTNAFDLLLLKCNLGKKHYINKGHIDTSQLLTDLGGFIIKLLIL